MKTFFAQAGAAPAAQATTTAPAAVSAAPAESAAASATANEIQPAECPPPRPQQQGGGISMLVPMLLIFALFYFMMIRPQQRKEKERRKMIDELRAGRKVVFAGGLFGTIVEAKEATFRIEIADGVVVEVARSSVQNVVDEAAAAEPAKK